MEEKQLIIVKDFFEKSINDEFLSMFCGLLLECWMSGANGIMCDFTDNEDKLPIIQTFFSDLYKGHEEFYYIEKNILDSDLPEYYIKWFFSPEEIEKNNSQNKKGNI